MDSNPLCEAAVDLDPVCVAECCWKRCEIGTYCIRGGDRIQGCDRIALQPSNAAASSIFPETQT
jgi:hypothetical protein